MPPDSDVTTIIVNYCTPHLLSIVTDSFKQVYPHVRLILVDNGSGDRSSRLIGKLQKEYERVDAILLNRNIYRGPAVNRALDLVKTRYFFLLDSDCRIKQGGFLEKMLKLFERPDVYAVGKVRYVLPLTGVPTKPQRSRKGIRYVETWGALFDKEKCAELGEFVVQGASGIVIARAAEKRRWEAAHFPLSIYIDHLGAGTRRMFQGSFRPKPGEKAGRWWGGERRF